MTALLEVEDLHAHYDKSHILHGVHLTIGAGEIVSLLGRNGSGRSTTLKTIMGLVRPSAGTVRWAASSCGGPGVPDRARRPRLRARGARDLCQPDGRREHAHRQQAARPGAHRVDAGPDVRLLSPPEGAPQYPGRQPLGRRAADADHLPLAARQSARDPRSTSRPRGWRRRSSRRSPRSSRDICRQGVSVLLVEQKLAIALQGRRRACTSWAMARSSSRGPRRRSAMRPRSAATGSRSPEAHPTPAPQCSASRPTANGSRIDFEHADYDSAIAGS